jgi:hypothetical protein
MTVKYLASVEHYSDGLHISVGCRGEHCEHAEEGESEHYCEASFSNRQCDSCGSTLAGDRSPATGWPIGEPFTTDNLIELDICTDCVLFHANGEVPEDWWRTAADWRDFDLYGDDDNGQ